VYDLSRSPDRDTCCNTLQLCRTCQARYIEIGTATQCNTLQQTATLQHTTTHCSTLQQTVYESSRPRVLSCIPPLYGYWCVCIHQYMICMHVCIYEDRCKGVREIEREGRGESARERERARHDDQGGDNHGEQPHRGRHCNTLQHTATHCHTLHHSAPHQQHTWI